jgi:hypothetical protein
MGSASSGDREVLTVITWWWGEKYSSDYVEKLHRGFKHHLKQPHRFVCVTDKLTSWVGFERWDIQDIGLTQIRGCFARLRMFDPDWQREHNIDDRLVCVDLDCIITGRLDQLFDRPEAFVILQGANSVNPCPYNGSVMMLRAGAHPEVWSELSLEAIKVMKCHEFPDDQGWLWHKIPNAAGWTAGRTSGIYAFGKPGWPRGDALPEQARLIAFPGWRDPGKYKYLPWIRQHWR